MYKFTIQFSHLQSDIRSNTWTDIHLLFCLVLNFKSSRCKMSNDIIKKKKNICNALQQNRKQVAHAFFWDMDKWSWQMGGGDSSVDFENCVFFTYLNICYHLQVISDFPEKSIPFLPFKSKTIGIGNFKDWILKSTLPEKQLTVLYTNGHISKKVGVVFGIKLHMKVCALQWYQKSHFTQNVICPLFFGSASQFRYEKTNNQKKTKQNKTKQQKESKDKNKTKRANESHNG